MLKARLIQSVSPFFPLASSLTLLSAWIQDYAAGASPKSGGPGPGIAGRSFYSSLGHNNSTWMDPTFMKHIMGGLVWTLASNTTRVAAGLYDGVQPTVRTGATNTAASTAESTWAPVLGSNQTAPAPPAGARPTPTSNADPESTGGASTSSTSGSMIRASTNVWAVVGAAAAMLGALF